MLRIGNAEGFLEVSRGFGKEFFDYCVTHQLIIAKLENSEKSTLPRSDQAVCDRCEIRKRSRMKTKTVRRS